MSGIDAVSKSWRLLTVDSYINLKKCRFLCRNWASDTGTKFASFFTPDKASVHPSTEEINTMSSIIHWRHVWRQIFANFIPTINCNTSPFDFEPQTHASQLRTEYDLQYVRHFINKLFVFMPFFTHDYNLDGTRINEGYFRYVEVFWRQASRQITMPDFLVNGHSFIQV